ncbi:MAG: cell envelope integrity protein TolA [Burkholderiales bacterium]|nr:cell envelope integrity protein TolA [Burkholderiales bacterium]
MLRRAGETGRMASAALAIAVHAAFFAFLYFGINWQPKEREPLMAELWSELPPRKPVSARQEPPPPRPAPKPQPRPEPKADPGPKPPPKELPKAEPKPSRADIQLEEKKRKLEEKKRKEAEDAKRRENEQKIRKDAERKRLEEEKKQKEEARREEDRRKREEQARQEELRRQDEAKRLEEERRQDEERRQQEATLEAEAEKRRNAILEERHRQEAARKAEADRVSALAKELASWQQRIQQRIRSKVVVPAGTPDTAQAEYVITIIPGGDVLSVKLRRSSGFPAYDEAVERAVLAASPLPVPSDPQLFQRLRELNLVFRPG